MTAVAQRRLGVEPTSAVIVGCSILAAFLRLYPFVRPGDLSGVVGYDDGVYFGASMQLVHGTLPYQDFVFVHPPLVPLLMTPFALLAKLSGTAGAFAAARVMSALVGVAGVAVLGRLLRHRGPVAVAIGCGILALHADTIESARSVFLEPYLALFCLCGLVVLFDGDRLTDRRRRLLWGGVLLGLGCAVKLFAIAPIVVVLAVSSRAPRRCGRIALGALAGFAVPVLPFFVLSPVDFARDVFGLPFDRTAARMLTGPRIWSLLGANDPHGWPRAVPYLLALALIAVVVTGYAAACRIEHRRPTHLEVVAVAATVLVAAMFLSAGQYFWHYAGFFAPFAALAVALPATALVRRRESAIALAAAAALVVGLVVVGGVHEVDSAQVEPVPVAAIQARVPVHACVVTNAPSLALVADRFTTQARCPAFVDGLGTDLVLGYRNSGARGVWLRTLARADYLLRLRGRRIFAPWHRDLSRWVAEHFRRVALPSHDVQIWIRR